MMNKLLLTLLILITPLTAENRNQTMTKAQAAKDVLVCGFCDGEGCCACDWFGMVTPENPLYGATLVDEFIEEAPRGDVK